MQECTQIVVSKSVSFEESGETISIQIQLENVSPKTKNTALSGTMDVLFKDVKEIIFP